MLGDTQKIADWQQGVLSAANFTELNFPNVVNPHVANAMEKPVPAPNRYIIKPHYYGR